MEETYYTFRQPESVSELRALLELRYSVYRESRMARFAPENSLQTDLDCHDLNAMHFGLFRHDRGMERPAGYMRLVTDRRQSFANDIVSFASEDPSVLKKVLQSPAGPFPVMGYAPTADRVKELYDELIGKSEQMVEPGRFSLDSSVRGRHVPIHMIASTFAVTIANGIDSAILSCAVQHNWIYKHFGFSQFPGTSEFVHENFGGRISLLLLLGVRASLPASERDKVMKMVEAYQKTGCICYNPLQPENFYAPEENPVEAMSEAA